MHAAAIRERRTIAIRPPDEAIVDRVLADFPGLKVERRDGYLIAPWHGREEGERVEVFAVRMRAETGCMVADRRIGRIVDLSQAVQKAG